MDAFARKLGGGRDQASSELPEVVEVLTCPQQAEGGADHGIVPGREGFAHALQDLSVIVVSTRMWRWDRRPLDEGIGEADIPGADRSDLSRQSLGAFVDARSAGGRGSER
jgi:hypothetical protein